MAFLTGEFAWWGWMCNEEYAARQALASFLAVRRDVFRAENSRLAQNILRALIR